MFNCANRHVRSRRKMRVAPARLLIRCLYRNLLLNNRHLRLLRGPALVKDLIANSAICYAYGSPPINPPPTRGFPATTPTPTLWNARLLSMLHTPPPFRYPDIDKISLSNPVLLTAAPVSLCLLLSLVTCCYLWLAYCRWCAYILLLFTFVCESWHPWHAPSLSARPLAPYMRGSRASRLDLHLWRIFCLIFGVALYLNRRSFLQLIRISSHLAIASWKDFTYRRQKL